MARGRLLHARFLEERNEDPDELTLFQRAIQIYRMVGDVRGEAESLFWIGCFHQVVRGDNAAAVPALEESCELARKARDKLTLSYALRHLGMAAYAAGRLDDACMRLEESVNLRREIGFQPGVAANLVALAYFAAERGRRDQAIMFLDEAAAIAVASDAGAIVRWVGGAQILVATRRAAEWLCSGRRHGVRRVLQGQRGQRRRALAERLILTTGTSSRRQLRDVAWHS